MKYEDMTESEAAAAFEEFMAERPAALDRLHGLLAEQGLDPSQVLDDSVASLRVVQEALCPMLRLRFGPRTRPTEGPTWARYDIPPRVDLASSWIIDAAVSYFCDVLLSAVPGTEWRLGGRRTRESLYRNRPLLMNGHNYLFPAGMVVADMEQRAFALDDFDPDLSKSGARMVDDLAQLADEVPRVGGNEATVRPLESGEQDLRVTFDPDLVYEVRFILTGIMRRLRKEPGVVDARWKGNRILVNAPAWAAEQMKAWWVAELEREFAGPI